MKNFIGLTAGMFCPIQDGVGMKNVHQRVGFMSRKQKRNVKQCRIQKSIKFWRKQFAEYFSASFKILEFAPKLFK